MILTDGVTTLDYFDKIPRDIKHAAVSVSGGIDSALSLYCLAASLHEHRQFRTEIHPYHMHNPAAKKLDTRVSANAVVDYVASAFPLVKINPLRVYNGDKEGSTSKLLVGLRTLIQLCDDVPIDWLINGQNKTDYVTISEHDDTTAAIEQHLLETHSDVFPWKDIDKHFIATQYKTLGIEKLLLLTNSCISDNFVGMPCKQCRWCLDRYNAFGNYDYGVV